MTKANQIASGMTINIKGDVCRVESAVTVTVSRGIPFVKTILKDLMTGKTIEKSFKVDADIEEVKLEVKDIEYLYLEGANHYFLDVQGLDQVCVDAGIIGDKVNYLKEGTRLGAMFYGSQVFSIELPPFLELMVVSTEDHKGKANLSNSTKVAVVETGAKIEVPLFIEAGDVIKVDTEENEFVQRV